MARPVSSVIVENAVSGERICEPNVTPELTVETLSEIVLRIIQERSGGQDFGKVCLLHEGACLTDGCQTLEQVGLQGAGCVLQALQCQRALLAAACDDSYIAVVDAETHAHVYSFIAHSKPVECIAFAPDGKVLASGSQDCTVRIWEVRVSMPCIQEPRL